MNSIKNKFPYLIPLGFILFISLGLASYKTILIGLAFSLSIFFGIIKGNNTNWKDKKIDLVNDRYIKILFSISLILIITQIFFMKKIPLLETSTRSNLDPLLTSLSYIFGIPSSIYLLMKGKKYSIIFPFVILLYGYRTPFIVSLLSMLLYSSQKRSKKEMSILLSLIILGSVIVTLFRGNTIQTMFIRIQGTTSVLDFIIHRVPVYGRYFGGLQWAGIRSYLVGGHSSRAFIGGLLGIKPDVTITGTLLGGMYIDWGIFSIVEGYILGYYFGMISNADQYFTNAIYYTTLSYGIIGIETGILDLPVYLLFIIGFWILIRGKYKIKVTKFA